MPSTIKILPWGLVFLLARYMYLRATKILLKKYDCQAGTENYTGLILDHIWLGVLIILAHCEILKLNREMTS